MNELENIKQAAEDAVYRWRLFREATSPIEWSNRLIKLNDAMGT